MSPILMLGFRRCRFCAVVGLCHFLFLIALLLVPLQAQESKPPRQIRFLALAALPPLEFPLPLDGHLPLDRPPRPLSVLSSKGRTELILSPNSFSKIVTIDAKLPVVALQGREDAVLRDWVTVKAPTAPLSASSPDFPWRSTSALLRLLV